jgi:two-component sensor histidine kinase
MTEKEQIKQRVRDISHRIRQNVNDTECLARQTARLLKERQELEGELRVALKKWEDMKKER